MAVDLPTAETKFDRELQIHPLAEMVPAMKDEEFKLLKANIAEVGLLVPITIYDGKVLSGRHRYKACWQLYDGGKGKFRFKQQDFAQYSGSSPLEFVMSENRHRRHLTPSQWAVIGAKLVNTTFGDNQYKRGIVTIAAAAIMVGVSKSSVETAKLVLSKGSPKVINAVSEGTKRVGAVKDHLDKSHLEQDKEIFKAPAPKTSKPKPSNPHLVEFDAFKERWQRFDEMQQRAFVMSFKDGIAKHLEYIKQQEAMIGGQQAA
jgi:hypothetical protein